MEWKKFEESDKEYPESIVQKRMQGFETATSDYASLSLEKLDGPKHLSSVVPGDFKFSLYVYSTFLKGFKFEIITFGYDIRLEPIQFEIEASIDEELFGKDTFFTTSKVRTVENAKDFDAVLEDIFNTNAFDTVIRGIIKIAKKTKPTA
jgi:hypothetical protein